MYFVLTVIVSLVLSVPVIGYFGGLAKDAVLKFNLRQISKAADIRFIEDGRYPNSLNKVLEEASAGNLSPNLNYTYKVTNDGQEAAILGAYSDRSYCWNSTTEVISDVSSNSDCPN